MKRTTPTRGGSAPRPLPLIGVLALAACAVRSAALPGVAVDGLDAAAATIGAADVRREVSVLAADSMRGRDTPSPGLEAAASRIESRLRALGLRGGAAGGAFVQRYPYPLLALDLDSARLALGTPAPGPAPRYGRDFLVLPGAAAHVGAAALYVGPAARFRDAELAPGSLAGWLPVTFLSGTLGGDWQVTLQAARAAAEEAGARAIVFVLAPDFPAEQFEQLRAFTEPARRVLGGMNGLTTVLLRYDAARPVFAAADLDLDGMRARADAAAHPVPMTGLTIRLGAPVRTLEAASAPNVVALLPGSDPKLRDSYVVLSAHMDHLGVGVPDASGDSIYNGADDDASGVAAVLEVAEAFARLPRRPARSILFLFVSGEEKGMLGSRWFTDHPPVPLDSVVADLNLDMVSRNAPDSIVVIGQEYSTLGARVRQLAAAHPELRLALGRDVWPQERFFYRSDHFNFVRHGVPALFFFAGTHEDYHRPSDEVARIDADKAARVARLAFYAAVAIAQSAQRPEWTERGLEEVGTLTR